jgi:hypothetical protein
VPTNPNRITVAQMARVFLAPFGTAATTALAALTPTSEIPTPFVETGLFTPDSLNWSTEPSFEEVRSHQSFYPTRRMQTEDNATLSVDLQEWSADNFIAVYGGGTVSLITAGNFKYVPPPPGARAEVAVVAEVVDGTKRYRYVIPRGMQVEGVEQDLGNSAEGTLPLRVAVLGVETGDPWYLLTNDPAFANVAGTPVAGGVPLGFQSVQYQSSNVDDLKAELKDKGLSTSGNKEELIERLTQHGGGADAVNPPAGESTGPGTTP